MSTLKSSNENLTLNADGSGNDIKFQSNGVEKASLTDGGVFTATSFTGSGANLTSLPADSTKLSLSGGAMTGAITTNSTFDGRDVATDGTKLDGIASSANNYVHPNHSGDVVSSADGAMTIQTDAVDIAMLSATGTASATTFLRGDNSWVTPTDTNTDTTYSAGSGLDLSGTTFSVEPDLRDGITHIGLDSTDYIGFNNNSHTSMVINGGEEFRLLADGTLHIDGDVIAFSATISDERLKHDIEPITDALSKVGQLNGVTFAYNKDDKKSAGLIAQDVEKVLPSAVTETELPLQHDDGIAYKTVKYDQTIGLLVEAIKELTTKVEELENK